VHRACERETPRPSLPQNSDPDSWPQDWPQEDFVTVPVATERPIAHDGAAVDAFPTCVPPPLSRRHRGGTSTPV
jgi:hypothetical protein